MRPNSRPRVQPNGTSGQDRQGDSGTLQSRCASVDRSASSRTRGSFISLRGERSFRNHAATRTLSDNKQIEIVSQLHLREHRPPHRAVVEGRMSGDPLLLDHECPYRKLLLDSFPDSLRRQWNKSEEDHQDDKAQGQHHNPGDLVGGVQYQNSCTCNDQADAGDRKAPVLPAVEGLRVEDRNDLVLCQLVLDRLNMNLWQPSYRGIRHRTPLCPGLTLTWRP